MSDPFTGDEILEMSDEEFAELPAPPEESESSGEESTEEDPGDNDPPEEPEEDEPEGDEPPTEEGDDNDTPSEEETVEGQEETDPDGEPSSEDPKEGESSAEESEDKNVSAEIDYKAEYERLMAPFKANGKVMTPEKPEDIIQLAQMGANYYEKMRGMAPARRALKLLEKNGLLDEGKLDHLIDLSKGDKGAIQQFLKDNNYDPDEYDPEQQPDYTPTKHTVSDQELALDEALNDIKGSKNQERTLITITQDWDETSRNEAANNPHIIRVINAHMDAGVYDVVKAAVDYDRSLGKFQGVSDFEAYKATGARLEAEGKLPGMQPPTPEKETLMETQKPAKSDPVKELKRKASKKAAKPTKTSAPIGKLPKDFNPLELSDEEFAKFDPKLLGIR